MPRFTLQRKLFLALAVALAALLLVFIALSRLGLQRNLGDYVAEIELSRMDWIAERLEQGYASHGNWRFMQDDPDAWHAAQMPGSWMDDRGRAQSSEAARSDRRPLPPPDGIRRGPPPQDGRGPPGLGGPGGPGGPGGVPQVDLLPRRMAPPPPPDAQGDPRSRPDSVYQRLALFDAAGDVRIAGAAIDRKHAVRRPLVHNGGTVGYLAVAPLPSEQSDAGRAFIAQQSSFVIATGLAGLVLALAMSTLLARRWLAPVRHLTDGARQVAAGRFDTQVPAQGDDELAMLARTFNDMARRLGDAEGSRQRWLSDVAHELRTPIAAARAEIEALQDGVRSFDQATANRLHQQVMRLNRLVDDLRLSMDGATGLPAMHWSVADPVHLLLQAAALAEPSFAQAGLRIDLARLQALQGKAATSVRVDTERLQQVFANLLHNSVRYTDPGGVLELNAEVPDGKTLVIRFDDSAPAPTPDDMPRLFERLYRGDTSRNRALGGSGLGLAICKAIVEAHAGTITAEPSPLGGLRITVQLPLLAA